MNTKVKVLIVVAGIAALVGYFTYLTMSEKTITCEVCVEFHGKTECRRATGKDRMEATMSAASTACGLLAGGVTDSIACQNTVPKSVSCEDR